MAEISFEPLVNNGNKRERKKHHNFFIPSVSQVLFGRKRQGNGEFRDEYPNVPIGKGKDHDFFLDTQALADQWANEPYHKIYID